jgi:hypothetical protein
VFEPGDLSTELDDLIAVQPGILRHFPRLRDMTVEIALGSNNKESSCLSQVKEPLKVEVSTVHDIDRSGDDWHLVEKAHIVDPSFCNIDKQWDGALKIQLGMNLNRGFGRPTCT